MKKWEEKDILGIGNITWSGPQIEKFFQQLMQNQNEIIDFIEEMRPKSYQEWAREQIKEALNDNTHS